MSPTKPDPSELERRRSRRVETFPGYFSEKRLTKEAFSPPSGEDENDCVVIWWKRKPLTNGNDVRLEHRVMNLEARLEKQNQKIAELKKEAFTRENVAKAAKDEEIASLKAELEVLSREKELTAAKDVEIAALQKKLSRVDKKLKKSDTHQVEILGTRMRLRKDSVEREREAEAEAEKNLVADKDQQISDLQKKVSKMEKKLGKQSDKHDKEIFEMKKESVAREAELKTTVEKLLEEREDMTVLFEDLRLIDYFDFLKKQPGVGMAKAVLSKSSVCPSPPEAPLPDALVNLALQDLDTDSEEQTELQN